MPLHQNSSPSYYGRYKITNILYEHALQIKIQSTTIELYKKVYFGKFFTKLLSGTFFSVYRPARPYPNSLCLNSSLIYNLKLPS